MRWLNENQNEDGRRARTFAQWARIYGVDLEDVRNLKAGDWIDPSGEIGKPIPGVARCYEDTWLEFMRAEGLG